MKTIVIGGSGGMTQCQKPRGWLGRLLLRNMNSRHSKLTDWGLSQISIEPGWTMLDVGCGGGRTISKLAEAAAQGKVYGIDFSETSVATSKRTNARSIDAGRVEVLHGSVSQLPFPDAMFDLVTAVETHFWWPDPQNDIREVYRVLKPGGRALVIAEIYKGANTPMAGLAEKYAPRTGLKLFDVEEHRGLFVGAGFSEIQIIEERDRGWICGLARKP